MKLSKSQADIVNKALNQWVEDGCLTSTQASELNKTIEIQKFDWKGLSTYSFYGALVCFVIAIVAIFSGNFFYKLVQQLLNAPDSIFAFAFTVLAAVMFVWGIRFRSSSMRINAEIVLVIISTLWGIALFFWNKAFQWNASMLAFILLFWASPSFFFALFFKSLLQWCLAVVALFFSLLFMLDILADAQFFFHAFNYSLRAAFCALLLLLGSMVIKNQTEIKLYYPVTFAISLIAFLFALWIISISGNSMSFDEWRAVSHWHFWPWILVFTITSAFVLWRGLKTDNDVLKGTGISFLLLDAYTRYFEFFWDSLHKALFFMFLAVSLWFVSRRAEQIANKSKQSSSSFFQLLFKKDKTQ